MRKLLNGYGTVAKGLCVLKDAAFRLFISLRAGWAPTALGVAAAIEGDDGRVLLVRHRYAPGWRLPGGGVNRGEPPQAAVLRELAEEVGLAGGTAQFFGLYTRKAGWATSVVALYRIRGAAVNFRPNLEISEICFADPRIPPQGCTPATLRRLKELTGAAELSPYW
jgi:ADP-ribose pyrophosphatase YjhB (NUDIX family)